MTLRDSIVIQREKYHKGSSNIFYSCTLIMKMQLYFLILHAFEHLMIFL